MVLQTRETVVQVLLFIQGIQVVNSLCSGSGFPLEWTPASIGVTYWYVTPLIKRQFGTGYEFRDIFTDTGVVHAPPPECQSEYYNPTTGYLYYLMYYTEENIYSVYTNLQICHAFKQYDGVIREYFEDLLNPNVLSDAKECVPRLATTTWSMALTQYDSAYYNGPFSNEEYYFTFSKGVNSDYCSGITSSAFIDKQTISLKSCFNPTEVNNANPFYGVFSCVSSWKPEASRDTPDGGDFIVVEMYDGVPWPYCGRFKVDANGVITMSLYLSISGGDWYPEFCEGSVDNTFMYESGTTIFTRLVFKPVIPRTTTDLISTTTPQSTTTTASATTTTFPTTTTTTLSTSTVTVYIAPGNSTTTLSTSIQDDTGNLDWQWWILIAASVVLLTTCACCIIYAGLRRRRKRSKKVDNVKQTEIQDIKTKSVGISNQPPADHSIRTKPKRPKVHRIQVKKFTQPKWQS